VSIGAPIELRIGKKRKVDSRWYVSDTEPNKIAHRLGIKCATDVLFPEHWNSKIDGGWLDYVVRKNVRLHRYEGLHGHVHLISPRLNDKKKEEGAPKILVRRLSGGGIHDRSELLKIEDALIDNKFDFEFRDEFESEKANWALPSELTKYSGVVTQSVTLASESAIQGVPTLLVSKAKRGFIEYLNTRYTNFYRVSDMMSEGYTKWNQMISNKEGNHLTTERWPNTRKRWIELFGPWAETLDQ